MSKALYDDGIYRVTAAIVSTPRRFYPLAHTTASLRRDPLWGALIFAALGAVCLGVYNDLLHFYEQVMVAVICGSALAAGSCVSVLRIAAVGHSGAMIVGRSGRIRALYSAIRDARTVDPALFGETGLERENQNQQ